MLKRIKKFLFYFFPYFKSKVNNQTYKRFYATMMDNLIEKNKSAYGSISSKSYHLDYLIKKGITSNSYLLDFGCGALSSGINFIKFLDTSHYFGIDISDKAIELGQSRILDENLPSKKPNLLSFDEDIPTFDIKFDYIFANSVFTHMPMNDIQDSILHLCKYLNSGSCFYSTLAASSSKSKMVGFRDWFHNPYDIIEFCTSNNLHCFVDPEWDNPLDKNKTDRMLVISSREVS